MRATYVDAVEALCGVANLQPRNRRPGTPPSHGFPVGKPTSICPSMGRQHPGTRAYGWTSKILKTREDEDEPEFVYVAVDESGCTCSFPDPKRSIRFRITDRPSADCEYSRRTPASRTQNPNTSLIVIQGFLADVPGFRLSPHQSMRGSSPELSGLKFRPGSDGLELTSDNSVSSLMLMTAPDRCAIWNDDSVEDLGLLYLSQLKTVGRVRILARNRWIQTRTNRTVIIHSHPAAQPALGPAGIVSPDWESPSTDRLELKSLQVQYRLLTRK
jgi:hypothetical protein